MSLSKLNEVIDRISCPACKKTLKITGTKFTCQNTKCKKVYPIINGIPVLINEETSIFKIKSIKERKETYQHQSSANIIKKIIKYFTPSISLNLKARSNYLELSKHLLKLNSRPNVLVIGGGVIGSGLDKIVNLDNINIIETDIYLGPRAVLVCDAHNIPFKKNTFDGVIVQAVLEHVLDPYQCVSEIHRILKKDGIVYAETPFMQQVHGGRYDFTRFTYLGHKRLFKKFRCMNDGAVGGPGMALAWSLKYFLLSFMKNHTLRSIFDTLANYAFFWLKYFDLFLIDKPGSLDAAAGYFFMGRKTGKNTQNVSDENLINLYRGTMK